MNRVEKSDLAQLCVTCLVLVLLSSSGCDRGSTNVAQQSADATRVEELRKAQFREELDTAINQSRWQVASALLDEELKRNPDQPDLVLLAARATFQDKQWRKADERFTDYVRLTDDTSDSLMTEWMHAKCLAGEIMDAITYLDGLPNKSIALHRIQGRLLVIVGDLHGARNAFEKIVQRGEPQPDELYAVTGLLGRAYKDPSFIAAATRRYPDDLRPRLGIAVEHWLRERVDESLVELEKIVEHHPDYPPAVGLYGFLLSYTGESDRLQTLFARSEPAETTDPIYWYAYGMALLEMDEVDAAIGCFTESMQHGDFRGIAASQLATLLGQKGERELAKEAAEQATLLQNLHLARRNFTSDEGKSQKSALMIGDALLALGRTSEAKAWARLARIIQEERVPDAEARIERLIAAANENDHAVGETLIAKLEHRYEYPSRDRTKTIAGNAADLKQSSADTEYEEPAAGPSGPPIRFRDEAAERGLVFSYDRGKPSSELGHWLHQMMGGGVAVADFDANGWDDVCFPQAGGHPLKRDLPEVREQTDQLFLNHRGQFEASPNALEAVDGTGYGQGIAAGDINDDGFPDLYVANIGANRLWLNNGDGTFQDITERAGISGERWTSSVAIADVNRDGFSDLIEINYCQIDEVLERVCRDSTGRMDACLPLEFPAEPDRLWISQGDGTFVEDPEWLEVDQPGRGMGLLVADLDQQPGVEVFVSNDITNNHLWEYDPAGFWSEMGIVRGLALGFNGQTQGSMGIATGDPDDDGDLDLIVTNYLLETNAYYEQLADGVFADEVRSSGLAGPSLPFVGFGAVMEDFNCDGSLDLFVTNGKTNRDPAVPDGAIPEPAQLFTWRNGQWGELVGSEATAAHPAPYFERNHVGRAAATGDFNHDGYPDLVVTHLDEPASLLLVQSTGRAEALGLRLVGTKASRDAVGSVVVVTTDRRQRRFQRIAGFGYYSSSCPTINVGLEDGETVKQVDVQWPSGQVQHFNALSPGRAWTLVEDGQAF